MNDVRSSDAIARNVDAVTVDGQGNTVTTHGHVQVLTPQAGEFQIYYVRVYRRGRWDGSLPRMRRRRRWKVRLLPASSARAAV